MAKSNTWEGRKNLKNAKEVIEEFEREYWQDMKDMARQEYEERMFRRGELPERFTARKLFGWSDKKYDQEYWERLERNWRQWKGKQARGRKIETIEEEEEIEEEKSGVREWTEEDDNKISNMVNPYYKL